MYKLNEELIDIAQRHSKLVEEDYKRTYKAVGESKAIYKGKQLPYLYLPTIYTGSDVNNFEKLAKDIFNIVNRSIDIYISYPEVRPVWNFDPRLEELILIPHRFKANVPMGRFDVFYYEDGSYKFCELNTDGTSAMNEETPLTDILIDTLVMNEIKKTHEIERYELYQSWVDEVRSIYKEYVDLGGVESQNPHVVIMDFMSKGSPLEFEEFKRAFEESGFNCNIISPDELKEENGDLYFENQRVDIIYRRLVTRDMMDHYEELQPLIRGIKANKTCIIGSIKSQIVHTKKYFEALHHPIVRKYFSEEELEYIDAHIPYTSALILDGQLETYIDNKDEYIIKPVDYYASKGVYAGKEFDSDTWRKMLLELSGTGYIIQEFCPKSVNKNLYFNEDGTFDVVEVNNITGLFLYNEKLKGLFTRAGTNAVISDLNDGYSLSSIVAE